MFQMQAPWWEMVVRAAVIYGSLLILVRVSGRRTVGQFTPFDLLVVMLLSESVSNGLAGEEQSITGGVISALTLITINIAVAFITARSTTVQTLVEGNAVLIGKDGKLFRDVLKRERVPLSDVEQALREADCDLADMRRAFLEADGQISVLQRSPHPET